MDKCNQNVYWWFKNSRRHRPSSNLVWHCQKKLNELAKKNKVTLYWVFGHIGDERNEKADELAKKAVYTPFKGPELVCSIGANTIRGSSKRKWKRMLGEAQPGMRQAKTIIGELDPKMVQGYPET